MECIQKIMGACEATGDSAHFDLVKAKEKLQNQPDGMDRKNTSKYIIY